MCIALYLETVSGFLDQMKGDAQPLLHHLILRKPKQSRYERVKQYEAFFLTGKFHRFSFKWSYMCAEFMLFISCDLRLVGSRGTGGLLLLGILSPRQQGWRVFEASALPQY